MEMNPYDMPPPELRLWWRTVLGFWYGGWLLFLVFAMGAVVWVIVACAVFDSCPGKPMAQLEVNENEQTA